MKKVIIIGATSGIGRAMAEQFLQKGYKVGISGRRQPLLDTFTASAPNTFISCFDVTAADRIDYFKKMITAMGGMDIFIYCAGIGDPTDLLDWNWDKITTDTNVNGFVELTNHAYNFFMEQGSGHVVGISSIAANRGNSLAPAYSASKAYMSIYLEGLWIKSKRNKWNIDVTDIQPGFVKTKMAKANKTFWEVPVAKAAQQIIQAIKDKKRKAYISKRWWLIAKLMKAIPMFLYKKFG